MTPTFRTPAALALALAAALSVAACDRRDDAAVDEAANPPQAATDPAPTDMQDTSMPASDDAAGLGTGTGGMRDGAGLPAGNDAVTVTSVELGNEVGADNRVSSPSSNFATGDTVHASVATNGTGGTVSTRWTFEDGQVVHTEDKLVPAGEQVTDFMVTNPSGWPAGTYTLEVSVDGQVVDTREYTIR